MTDEERQIRAIVEYIEDIGEPEARWPKREFEMVSYSRWAANMILAWILSNPDWTPMRAVEEFKYLMNKFLQKPTNYLEVELMFQAAYDTATDISDILLAMLPY